MRLDTGILQVPNLLNFSADTGTTGIRRVTWDGQDDSSELDPNGLSGIDLTEGGVLDELVLNLGADLPGGELILIVNSGLDGAVESQVKVGIPVTLGGAPVETVTIPFGAFVNADFTNVGAIRLLIQGAPVSSERLVRR